MHITPGFHQFHIDNWNILITYELLKIIHILTSVWNSKGTRKVSRIFDLLSTFNLDCWTYMSKYMTCTPCDSFSSNNINMKSFNYILKRKNCLFLFVLVRWFWKRALNNKFYGRLCNIKPLFKHKEIKYNLQKFTFLITARKYYVMYVYYSLYLIFSFVLNINKMGKNSFKK